jgi:glycosyltransferase involved in cell wall biosynthesis
MALSREAQQLLEDRSDGGVVDYVTLARLRGMGWLATLKFLRTLNATRVVVAMRDEQEASLGPYLRLLAAFASTKTIEIVTFDSRVSEVSRWSALPSLVRAVTASLGGYFALARCYLNLRRLSDQRRVRGVSLEGRRVLYLQSISPFGVVAGGSVGHTAGVVNAFIQLGFSVDFVAPHAPLVLDHRVQPERAVIPATCAVPVETNYYRVGHAVTRAGMGRAVQARPSLVYARQKIGDYSGVVLSRRLKVPLVLEYNGSEVWVAANWAVSNLRYKSLALQAEELCLQHAHVVVTVSEVLREELLLRGIEPGRIVCYPNCVDPEIFNPARFDGVTRSRVRARVGISDDATVVTFVGTFGPWHGATVFATAIRALVENAVDWLERRRVHFLLVGDGQTMPEVRQILDGCGCDRFVAFVGLVPQSEAPGYLAASDIVVAPHVPNPDGSRFFGSPTKLFEYMAMEKAIVASDLEQIGEVLRDSLRVGELPTKGPSRAESRLAVLTRPGSVDDLIEGVRFLIDRPEWRTVLGANACKLVLGRYTWDRQVSTVMKALEGVLAKESG